MCFGTNAAVDTLSPTPAERIHGINTEATVGLEVGERS